ncbi:TPA: hypothetical protein UMF74_000466 [Stenotrophomonas maltophilia]|jgi:hypothetical protein|nr:hypothetical protein [Stenotrophomonas maltophilia]
MNTARAAWTAEYREARKLARFIDTFHDKLCSVPVMERTFPQCRGFEFARLSGDNLRWIGDGLFAPGVKCHHTRLACLRHQQPRLPA